MPTIYSKAELEFIKENCKLGRDELSQLCSKRFQRAISPNAIRKICSRYGFYSDHSGGFRKGQNSWKDGKPAVMIPKNGFKKGIPPVLKKKLNTERRQGKAIWVKVAEPDVWMSRAEYVWRQHHGQVPSDKVIWHIDGNQENDSIDNLTLLSRLELLQINRLQPKKQPPAYRKTLELCGRIKAVVIEANKHER
ncbi:HNH endonuclease [Actinobacillus pleuropneumoniae]|uniref:HNH endonuclease n=1 Tax=Actinobacillus pleuropneumoniae TaxID=715 RepID=UPI0005C56183|nr:HNH endonuclease [Actinobacillus pleuropneumoniae]UKH40799.1 HNH endonuclease [Actinobacillus pleuropneumoniae serovar 4 str. M62]USQ17111.1 HNH endonuclease [Actinobacillus pleuropneumoniae]SQF64319.1 Uncharacterised protein [Actinobacillus pleuropneumoniae]